MGFSKSRRRITEVQCRSRLHHRPRFDRLSMIDHFPSIKVYSGEGVRTLNTTMRVIVLMC